MYNFVTGAQFLIPQNVYFMVAFGATSPRHTVFQNSVYKSSTILPHSLTEGSYKNYYVLLCITLKASSSRPVWVMFIGWTHIDEQQT